MVAVTTNGHGAIGTVSNDAELLIGTPFGIDLTLRGTAHMLFHRYSVESVLEKSNAAKGSAAKKTDDVESYVYRDAKGQICLPGRYLMRAIIEAARFEQDPRSPRKSAMDLMKAAIAVDPLLTPVLVKGKAVKEWDYLDQQRVVVQRNAVPRIRPAFFDGWEAKFTILSLLPEYATPEFLRKLVDNAGKFIGLADFRPTYGRFVITAWKDR